jgi:flagellum-specific ATP synthase
MGAFAQAELMIQAGLYTSGTDAKIDAAIATRDALETFISTEGKHGPAGAFLLLQRAVQLPATL